MAVECHKTTWAADRKVGCMTVRAIYDRSLGYGEAWQEDDIAQGGTYGHRQKRQLL